MKRLFGGLGLLLALAVLFAGAGRMQKAPLQEGDWAFVRWVVDGDTVVLSDGTNVRYIGINTPEIRHGDKGVDQPYGREATAFNRNLVHRKRVRLEFDAERTDRYGRLLAYLYLEDGTFVNRELICRGYARLMTIPPNVRHADELRRCQREAREGKRGLWGER